jgi:type IV fimbrial biogenesis protein FimT
MRGRSCTRGVTLLELIITIAITAVLMAVAVPYLGRAVTNNRVMTQVNDLTGAFLMARAEAVSRNTPVSVCAAASVGATTCSAGTNWANGWLVFTDQPANGQVDGTDTIIRSVDALKGGSTLTATAAFVRFQSNGFPAAALTLQLRSIKCTPTSNRDIVINVQGHASYVNAVCP